MAFKLVYTSAPKGLKEGSFGFCTVGCSRNLSDRTIAALEAFSGYRRLFVDAEHVSQNPVAYSHVLLDDGETTLRVLSRIADAGLDYSARNNKIASHLILGHAELREAGPAAFFDEPDLFAKRWEGDPQIFETPFVLPKLTSSVATCQEWKKLTGDSGWAGVLASTVYTDRPVVLIVRPEHNVLALYQEALALLSPAMRWQATFSTYYTRTPPGIRCQWKATMAGSSESQTTRAIPYVLILDLTTPRMMISPESVDSSPQTSRLIDAARGLVISETLSSRSDLEPPAYDVQKERDDSIDNSDFEKNVPLEERRPIEKKVTVPLLNKVTSVIKTFDYRRGLPNSLKTILDQNDNEQRRWRFIGVALVGVFAVAALIVMGTNIANLAGKKAQSLQEDVSQNEQTSKSVAVESNSPDKSQASNVDKEEEKQTVAESDLNLSSLSDESPNDPFAFDEKEVEEEIEENAENDVFQFSSPETTSEASTSKSDPIGEKGEESVDGTDLSDLFRSPSLISPRRPQFLSAQEYQTTVKFQELVEKREFTVDFGVFQRKGNTDGRTLNEEITGEAQEAFSDIVKLCKQFNGRLAITCDLSADQNNERQWSGSKARTNKQEFDFSDIKSPNSAKITFKTTDGNNEPNGSLSIEIDPQGKLAFCMSDESTRDYFLRSSRLKWKLILTDSAGKDKDFVVETQYAQLLKPCEFDLLKDSRIVASIIELSNDGLLPLAVPNDLSYYDPVRNPKLSPALLVLLNPDSTPGAFKVESQMDDKKKSIVFIFRLKAENVDAFKIRFTRNSQVVKTETVIDRDKLNLELNDFVSRRSYPVFPYDSDVASPQERLQNALHEIDSSQNRKLTFDFYLVSTTGTDQHNKNKNKYIFLGSASVTPKELEQREK